MTRPSEIKPREGDQPGTLYDDYEIGAPIGPLSFTVTPDIVREYVGLVDGNPDAYVIDGRKASLPSVISAYFMAVLYQRYPPQQGGIMAANKFTFHDPIWADENTELIGTGVIKSKFEKRGRRYVQYHAEFHRPDGTLVATALNTSTFPH